MIERELTLMERIAIAEEFLKHDVDDYIAFFYTGGFPSWKQIGGSYPTWDDAWYGCNADIAATGNIREMYRVVSRRLSQIIV